MPNRNIKIDGNKNNIPIATFVKPGKSIRVKLTTANEQDQELVETRQASKRCKTKFGTKNRRI